MPNKYKDVIARDMTHEERIKEQIHVEFMETLEELRIKQLEEQVRHAEEHGGMTDTAHHEMLRRAKAGKTPPQPSVPERPADRFGGEPKEDKEIANG